MPVSHGSGGRAQAPSMTHLSSTMEKKTKIVKLRLTPSQLEGIKSRSKPFGTMSNFIVQALNEFSDSTAKEKIEVSKRLAELYVSIDAKLAHAGGNLNQAMRRINEINQAGLDYSSLLKDKLLPEVQSCTSLCIEVRKLLSDITLNAVR